MARKVTTQVISAFLAGKPLTVSNSSTDGSNLFLFGNLIAKKGVDGLFISNAGWQSNITKERLNALPNVSIQQKSGVWYLNGKVWDGQWINVTDSK